MRHSRIAKSKRHKKLKTINDLSNYNVVSDKLLAKNKEQAIPRKWTQIMETKETNKQAAKQAKEGNSKRINKLKKKYDTLSVKTGVNQSIERGMTRVPKPMPETVEKGILESDYQFINRLNRMVSKSIAEATLEDHFDVDLGGKVKPGQMTAAEDKAAASLISPEERKMIEKKLNKRRQKDQKRKERRLKKQTKLVKMIKSQEFAFKKDTVQYGDLVHEPPALTFSKRAKLNTVK